MSSFAGKTPVRTVEETVLYRELDACSCFKFIAFKELQFPFRHTGFLLFFDNVPKYTINVRTADDSWSHWVQSLVVAPGRTTVEPADALAQVQYVGRPVVHVLGDDKQRQRAWEDLATLLAPKRWYSLLWNNCRDHVRGIMGSLDERHPGMHEAGRQDLRQTNVEDWGILAVIFMLVAVPVSIAFKR